jgi:hypothetical protein
MLIDDLIQEISKTHDPLLKQCLNEIVFLNMIKLELEGELLAQGYVDALKSIKEKHNL